VAIAHDPTGSSPSRMPTKSSGLRNSLAHRGVSQSLEVERLPRRGDPTARRGSRRALGDDTRICGDSTLATDVLSRNQPHVPATVDLTRAEIDAAILIRKPHGVRRGAPVTNFPGCALGRPISAAIQANPRGGRLAQSSSHAALDHIRSAATLLADGEL